MATQQCDRCGIPAHETPEGFLAYNDSRLVCADCNSALDDEWCAETGGIHPLDTLNPTAAYFAHRREVAAHAKANGYVGPSVSLDPLS